jgi:Ca-activated chloride channel family protein
MAQQITFRAAVGYVQSPVIKVPRRGNFAPHRLLIAWILFALLTPISNLNARSLASKNREGNRLFAQGKYEAAERAYLDAQVNNPGRPEVLYNLGNSLIKQKKYNQGIQALHQSMSKGSDQIKENSWFNAGNALFLAGNYKDSAQAFIQALRLNPEDRDAKNNLEMALKKLKEQERKNADNSPKQGNAEKKSANASKDGADHQNRSSNKDSDSSARSNKPSESQKNATAPPVQPKGSISKERALQILQAVQNQELEEQRKLLQSRSNRKFAGKDW